MPYYRSSSDTNTGYSKLKNMMIKDLTPACAQGVDSGSEKVIVSFPSFFVSLRTSHPFERAIWLSVAIASNQSALVATHQVMNKRSPIETIHGYLSSDAAHLRSSSLRGDRIFKNNILKVCRFSRCARLWFNTVGNENARATSTGIGVFIRHSRLSLVGRQEKV